MCHVLPVCHVCVTYVSCVTCMSCVSHLCVTYATHLCNLGITCILHYVSSVCHVYVICSVTDQQTTMDDSPDDLEIADAGEVIAVTIHRTDKLKTDFIMSHPVVRVTVVNGDTGMLLKKQHRLVEVSVSQGVCESGLLGLATTVPCRD